MGLMHSAMVISVSASLRLFRYRGDAPSDGNLPTRFFAFILVRLFFRLGIMLAFVPVLVFLVRLFLLGIMLAFVPVSFFRYGFDASTGCKQSVLLI